MVISKAAIRHMMLINGTCKHASSLSARIIIIMNIASLYFQNAITADPYFIMMYIAIFYNKDIASHYLYAFAPAIKNFTAI